jgi:hypothetical protein
MIDEKELSAALHELADRDETGTPAVDQLLRRGRRARFGRVARTATATAALVVGVALVAEPSAPAPVPLALAVQNTARTTFHLRFDVAMGDDPANLDPLVPSEGEYDPANDRGYLRAIMPPGEPLWEHRQIGADCYFTGSGDGWRRISDCWKPSTEPETEGLGASANPRELLAQLEQAGQVSYAGRTGEGSRAIDTYRFGYEVVDNDGTESKSGTVDIDVDSRRIVKVSYRVSSTLRGLGARLRTVPFHVEITLDDFGTPVDVDVPSPIVPLE